MVLPDVQYGMLELRIEIDFESAEMERVGLERGYDSPGPDADIDAHSVGYGDNWLNCVHEQFTPRHWSCQAWCRRHGWADEWELLELVQ